MRYSNLSKRFLYLLPGLLLSAALTGCGSYHSSDSAANAVPHHQHHVMPNGDVQESTEGPGQLPLFLDGKQTSIIEAYQLAAKHSDLLQWVPCYCGCGLTAGHSSNLQCFIAEQSDNGTITWDDHGTRCGVCIDIALQAARLQNQGYSIIEIRQWIDERYSSMNVEPTQTPLPAS